MRRHGVADRGPRTLGWAMRRSVRLLGVATIVSAASLSLVPGAAQAAERAATSTTVSSCKAVYALTGTWKGRTNGFTSTVTLYNTGPTAVSDWTLSVSLGSGAAVTTVWNGTRAQSGHVLTVTPGATNAVLPAGRSIVLGFTAKGVNAKPDAISLSGTACTETVSRSKVTPGVAAALGAALEAQASAGQARGATLADLRNRVVQMKRDEARKNVKAEINHLNGFIREFHWPKAKIEVTPTGTTALLAVAAATKASLV